jgi:hypothetical protein
MSQNNAKSMTHDDLDKCLDQLLLCCSALKMPVLIALQDSPSSFRSLAANEQFSSGQKLKLLRMLLKSRDIDQFFREVSIEAKREGHNSLFLKAIGIPEKVQ